MGSPALTRLTYAADRSIELAGDEERTFGRSVALIRRVVYESSVRLGGRTGSSDGGGGDDDLRV